MKHYSILSAKFIKVLENVNIACYNFLVALELKENHRQINPIAVQPTSWLWTHIKMYGLTCLQISKYQKFFLFKTVTTYFNYGHTST
jgi:hypothetical protein